MLDPFDNGFNLKDWFDPTLNTAGWFDDELADSTAPPAAYTLTAGFASFAETGIASGLLAKRIEPASLATFSETGISAGVRTARIQPAGVTAYAESGIVAGLLAARTSAATAGAFAESSPAPVLDAAYRLSAPLGPFALTGNNADAVNGGTRTMAGDPGGFNVTGLDANLTYATNQAGLPPRATYESPAWHHHVLRGSTGRFGVVSGDAKLAPARGLTAQTFQLALNGADALLGADRGLKGKRARFTAKGKRADFRVMRLLAPASREHRILGVATTAQPVYVEPELSDDELIAIVMAYELLEAA